MQIIFVLLSFLSFPLWAQSDLCDILELDSCYTVTKQLRRLSSASLPSPAASANLNPANVSFDRGLGVELIYQPNNPLSFNLASGSGKLGGALISQSLENSFFGNRVIELDQELLERSEDKKQYKSEKLNLALGGKLFRKKHFALDAGVLLKRHSEIKRINPGVGISGRLGPVHLGASVYQDDLFLDLAGQNDPTGVPYSVLFGQETYTEKFTVQTYSIGTRIKNLSLDAGIIQTEYEFYDEKSTIHLYSSSLSLGQYLINFAIRNEITPAMKFIDGELVTQNSQNEIFTGLQRSIGRHVIVGLNYNFFLLREVSLNGTFFF
ncbi:MAG: hypothetical protein H0V66_13050 [Bdellovibrionales bacterium]|nr:hypothetical protein [Bdellovibrionales bacterium]